MKTTLKENHVSVFDRRIYNTKDIGKSQFIF